MALERFLAVRPAFPCTRYLTQVVRPRSMGRTRGRKGGCVSPLVCVRALLWSVCGMRELIEFDKLSGSGNDFVCIDNRDGGCDGLLCSAPEVGRFAAALCHRGLGVGADGVIFAVRPSDSQAADVAVRFFEPDGLEVELCGNGTACFARWVVDSGWVGCGMVHIETP